MTSRTMKKPSKPKHIPMRTCIATGMKKPKAELMRLVKGVDGVVRVDPRSKLPGRGANITMTIEAFELAVKKRAIQRTLKLEKPLSIEETQEIRDAFKKAIEERTFRPNDKSVTIRVKKEDFLRTK